MLIVSVALLRITHNVSPCVHMMQKHLHLIHTKLIGWSNNHVNNLHFIISLETTQITTCAAESSFMCCVAVET